MALTQVRPEGLGFVNGRRNLIINGAMQVAQRGTSSTGVSGGGYETVDRFRTAYNGTPDELRVTHAQVTDAPDGFSNSFKLTVTTPETTLAADERVRFHQRIEGFNLQQLAFGTSSASAITLSFYVKSSIAGTYGVDLKNNSATRQAAQSYTISSANTWEKKTLTFAGDTAGAFNNDNSNALNVSWVLAAGTNYTSGTLATAFEAATNANTAPSGQVNLIGTDNATWQLTGVQLEVGTNASDFEHESYAETLQKCQRYYQTFRVGATFYASGTQTWRWVHQYFNTMRAIPTGTITNANGTSTINTQTVTSVETQFTSSGAGTNVLRGNVFMDAEL